MPKAKNQPELERLLKRGVVELVDRDHLIERLTRGDRLRVKLGIDPTDPSLHLGHTVVLRKLHQFQQVGHQAVIIIGDWTAQIGDPSGKDKTRPPLAGSVVRQNARSYTQQIFRILDRSSTEVHFQSEWFGKLKLNQFFELISQISAQLLLDHETFRQRLKKDQPLAVHELMYPVLQGYDSVMVRADLELGAIEQKFNLLMGRKLQRIFGQNEQDVLMMPYLTGTDGRKKMSKSLGNTINLTDRPEEVYGKVMSIPDQLIVEYFTIGTDLTDKGLALVKEEVKRQPGKVKARLAFLVTETIWDELAAASAQAMFDQVHRRRQLPEKLTVIKVDQRQLTVGQILIESRFTRSHAEGQRLVNQGGVKIDGRRQTNWRANITIDPSIIIQVGKRRFAKVWYGPRQK